MTFDLRIPPKELSALPTRPATKTGFAQALSCGLQEQQKHKKHQVNKILQNILRFTGEKKIEVAAFVSQIAELLD